MSGGALTTTPLCGGGGVGPRAHVLITMVGGPSSGTTNDVVLQVVQVYLHWIFQGVRRLGASLCSTK